MWAERLCRSMSYSSASPARASSWALTIEKAAEASDGGFGSYRDPGPSWEGSPADRVRAHLAFDVVVELALQNREVGLLTGPKVDLLAS